MTYLHITIIFGFKIHKALYVHTLDINIELNKLEFMKNESNVNNNEEALSIHTIPAGLRSRRSVK